MTDFGTSIDVLTDLPAGRWVRASGPRNLVCSVCRRVTTPRGSLPLHPDYGLDIRDLLGDVVTATSIRQAEQQFAREVERDERVASCTCSFSYTRQTETLRAAFVVEPLTGGTLTLILAASAVTVALIEAG